MVSTVSTATATSWVRLPRAIHKNRLKRTSDADAIHCAVNCATSTGSPRKQWARALCGIARCHLTTQIRQKRIRESLAGGRYCAAVAFGEDFVFKTVAAVDADPPDTCGGQDCASSECYAHRELHILSRLAARPTFAGDAASVLLPSFSQKLPWSCAMVLPRRQTDLLGVIVELGDRPVTRRFLWDDVVAPLFRGLEHLHTRVDVAIGDIKPDNIVVRDFRVEDGQARVGSVEFIDLDQAVDLSARISSDRAATVLREGTPTYVDLEAVWLGVYGLAPTLAGTARDVLEDRDVWSLAITALVARFRHFPNCSAPGLDPTRLSPAMVVGHPDWAAARPFIEEVAANIVADVRAGPVDPDLQDVDDMLCRCIRHRSLDERLATGPVRRLSHFQALACALEARELDEKL